MARKVTLEQYIAEAKERFGEDTMAWKFVCPACGHVASAADYKATGAPEGAVGFSCIGRWSGTARRTAFGDKNKPGPCDYTGGGLFRISPVEIEGHGRYFDFAEIEGEHV